MATLYLHASAKEEEKTLFLDIVREGIGPRYLLTKEDVLNLSSYQSIRVVVFSKIPGERFAEGMYRNHIQNGYSNHKRPRPRYDVYIDGLKEIAWKPEANDIPIKEYNGTYFDLRDTLGI